MERRTFLKWAINGLGAVVAAVLGVPAVAYLLDPRNRATPAGDFKAVGRLRDLQRQGRPVEGVIREVRRDAWTLHPNELVGRVWLVCEDKGGPDDALDVADPTDPKKKVTAFTTICPHLGCSVNYEAKDNRFVCPCHNGTFHLSGQPVPAQEAGYNNPAPRGMDRLELRLVEDPASPADQKDYVIEVKYQNFEKGVPERVAKA